MYKFNAVLLKIPAKFFTDLQRTILNIIRKNKKSQDSQNNLYNKRISGSITILDFKLYYRVIVLKTA